MYSVPSMKNVSKVKISEDNVLNNSDPEIEFDKESKKSKDKKTLEFKSS